jgi:polar amino acid transport system substrate-binding protein
MTRFSRLRCGRIERAKRAAAAALVAAALSPFGSAARAADIAPPEAIAKAGRIVFCSDMTGPPLEFLDESTKPVGSDIDIGRDIAKRFGSRRATHHRPYV